jgi:nitroimidazol reductase NimA-like FMN-containing flavoprotein (pyridoxamine 5'-phosphate oxidase superfamily)
MLSRMKTMLEEYDACVLATVSEGKPHCSLMAYVTDDGCTEIFMVTPRNTTKYENLLKNPLVSLLVDTRDRHFPDNRSEAKALTVEGRCREIKDDGKREYVKQKLVEKHPQLKSMVDDEQAAFLGIQIQSFLLLNGVQDAHFEEVGEA